jgi:hypothetical protein
MKPVKGLGSMERLRQRFVGFKGRLGEELVGPLNMNEEADEDERNHEKLVKQQVWRHDDIPSHDSERRRFYRISPLTYYPLVAGTPPGSPRLRQRAPVKLQF